MILLILLPILGAMYLLARGCGETLGRRSDELADFERHLMAKYLDRQQEKS